MKYLLLITLMTPLLLAAPAFNGKRTFTQPDGETIEYRLQGDEYLHWLETNDGRLMLYNKKNKQLESIKIEGDSIKPSGNAINQKTIKTSKKRTSRSLKIEVNDTVTKENLLKLQQEKRLKRHPKKSTLHQHDSH